MVDILIIFWVQQFFRVQITTFSGKSDIFIIFRVHQVQIKKVTLNPNIKRGGGSVRFGVPTGLKYTTYTNYYKDVIYIYIYTTALPL